MIQILNTKMTRTLTVTLLLLFLAGCQALPGRRENPVDQHKKNDTDKKGESPTDKKDTHKKNTVTGEDPIPDGVEVITDETPDKKKRPLKTFFYAQELIREKIKKDGKEIIRISLVGNAVIRHNRVTLRSPKIILEDGKKGMLRGGVTIYDQDSGTTIRAASADYSRDDQTASLSGSPMIIVKQTGEDGKKLSAPAYVTTTRIEQDLAENIAFMKSDVRIHHEDRTILADQGYFYGNDKLFKLKTDPVVIAPDMYMTGESMQYQTELRRFSLENRVTAYFRSTGGLLPGEDASTEEVVSLEGFARSGGRVPDRNKKDDRQKEEKPVVSVLTADRLTYMSGSENVDAITELTGNVKLTRENFLMEAPYIRTAGDNMKYILADRGARLIDKDNNVIASAMLMRFDTNEQVLRLERDAHIDAFDKDTDEKIGDMKAAVIEAYFREKKTLARGGVRLQQKDYIATGEIIRYEQSSGIAVIEGNPGLTRGTSTVHSQRILVYPDKNRILLMDGITGKIVD